MRTRFSPLIIATYLSIFFFPLQEFVDSFSRTLAYEYSSHGVEVQV